MRGVQSSCPHVLNVVNASGPGAVSPCAATLPGEAPCLLQGRSCPGPECGAYVSDHPVCPPRPCSMLPVVEVPSSSGLRGQRSNMPHLRGGDLCLRPWGCVVPFQVGGRGLRWPCVHTSSQGSRWTLWARLWLIRAPQRAGAPAVRLSAFPCWLPVALVPEVGVL